MIRAACSRGGATARPEPFVVHDDRDRSQRGPRGWPNYSCRLSIPGEPFAERYEGISVALQPLGGGRFRLGTWTMSCEQRASIG